MADDKRETSSETCSCQGADLMVVGPDLGGGVRPAVRHRPDHRVDVGKVYPVKEGQPIGPETLLLTKRGEGPLYDVEPALSESKGPAKVATTAYREGWDRIFGSPKAKLN